MIGKIFLTFRLINSKIQYVEVWITSYAVKWVNKKHIIDYLFLLYTLFGNK